MSFADLMNPVLLLLQFAALVASVVFVVARLKTTTETVDRTVSQLTVELHELTKTVQEARIDLAGYRATQEALDKRVHALEHRVERDH